MLVFAPQNVIRDPPFTKLDLVVCRNVLIYLDGDAQRRLLPVFHYAMRSGGLLFLGPSESIGRFADLFEPLDNKWKIFRKKETVSPMYPLMELLAEPTGARHVETPPRDHFAPIKQSQTTAHIERVVLGRFAPTTLVVNERGTIVYIHGRTGAYLEPTEGQPRNNILEMARHGLLRPLTAALRQASIERREVVRENIRVKSNGDYTNINFSVSRIEDPEPIRGLLLVTITPTQAAPSPTPMQQGEKADDHITRADELEHQLQYTKESLQTTIEELETSNEELKSTNEELQSTNEELQSTNEELETSKEEMQSLNEELSTVNTELQAKVDELSRATDDMQNLLNSTQVATIFLDSQFNSVRLPLSREPIDDAHTERPQLAAPARPLRILLAEDTRSSQQVIAAILRKRGHTVAVADDGRKALDLAGRENFDVILMDVQMPVLDGLQATAAIRKREAETGLGIRDWRLDKDKRATGADCPNSNPQSPIPDLQSPTPSSRVPIVALTAHAYRDDAERCMAVGMDAFLCKPVKSEELIDLVERLAEPMSCGAAVPPASAAETAAPQDTTTVFSYDDAPKSCLNNPGLFQDIIEFLFEEAGPMLQQARDGLEHCDAEKMAKAAHRLKGTVIHLGAGRKGGPAARRTNGFCR